jgi:ribonuclease R
LTRERRGLRAPRVHETPIPEREDILDALREAGVPVDPDALARRLDVSEAAAEGFGRRLAAMEREGEIIANRRGALGLPAKMDLIRGRVVGHPDGYGFLVPDDASGDLFLGPGEMQKVLHGDRVLAREVQAPRRGKREAVVVEVLERGNRRVVGRLHVEHGVRFVVAEERRLAQDILIAPDDRSGARDGQVVVAEIIEQPTRRTQPIGRIVEVLGGHADPGMEIEIALRKHDLPHVFGTAVERLASRLPSEPRKADLKGRVDLRELPLVTIDGETARDFDDAVCCVSLEPATGRVPTGATARRGRRAGATAVEADASSTPAPAPGRAAGLRRRVSALFRSSVPSTAPESTAGAPGSGAAPAAGAAFRLFVAIADVSHYVRPGDAIDVEALARGTSVYFPRRVIPMLPEALSNGLCSLNPGVDRLCMVCEVDVSAEGRLLDYRFYPAVMHSRARLTYTEVAEILAGSPMAYARNYRELVPHLKTLEAVFRALLSARAQRGAIDFESAETRMLFDEHGKIERIVPVERNDAHRLIEECMLAANVCASHFLARHAHPMLYRIHAGPRRDRLESLREFLRGFGLSIGGGDAPHARDYAQVLDQIRDRPDRLLLQTVMLRSLAQAVYSPDNIGHFGLAYDGYTHFTSPIRRYPDLCVHRAIRAVLEGGRHEPAGGMDWASLGQHCSQTERRADEASREVEAWLKCFYMQDRVGERFAGTLSGVASFGVFVTLDDLYVDGLVHISELGNDYFHFDAVRHQLLGERTGQRYRIGDRIAVQVARVDLTTSRIDFVLAPGTRLRGPLAASGQRAGKGARAAERGGRGRGGR